MLRKMIFFILFLPLLSYASYYQTLPKGVKNFTYRFIQTGEITGSFSSAGNFKGYNVNATINADSLKGINSAVDTYLNSLSAEDYKNLSFGTFEGSASSKVSAQVLAGGFGVTDNLTLYTYIPFYNAVVDLRVERTVKGRNTVNSDVISLENLPDVDVRLLQSLFVNYYKYQPLGRWEAGNFGDAEFGFMYKIKEWPRAGILLTSGFIAPTGRIDNPDIIQDIAFGDGQWDGFLEFGGGFTLNDYVGVDNWVRYTYQFPYTTELRLPDSKAFPVTRNKGNTRIKLGNKFTENLQSTFTITDAWSTSLLYTLESQEAASYESSSTIANQILSTDTQKLSHSARLGLSFSTLNLYKQKLFKFPIQLTLSAQTYFAGKNIPQYSLADLELKIFF
jgi:hypothetical protein